MSLPHDISGSLSKNRFRIELLWGISKMLDLYDSAEDFTMVFDYACDIEVHYSDGFEFYQIKSHKGVVNYTCKKLTTIDGEGSILGKLYVLKKGNNGITAKLAVVSNGYLKYGDAVETSLEYCLNTLPPLKKSELENAIKSELNLVDVDLSDVFFLHTDVNLQDPKNEIMGKLVIAFQKIKNCEPINPNALYRLIYDTVVDKACYEYTCEEYASVISNKGLSKAEFNRILDIHTQNAKTGIRQTENYIDSLVDIRAKRQYKKVFPKALNSLCSSKSLKALEKEIGAFLVEHENSMSDIETEIDVLKLNFHDKFTTEYSNAEKIVIYIIIIYRFTEGVYDETDI